MQPELHQLSCEPTRTLSEIVQLLTDKATLLRVMDVDHTTMWVKNASRMAYQGAQTARIIIYLLPLHITDLKSLIERLHVMFELCDSKVREQAPNMPSISRCT
jgi:hypothetical protein